MKVADHEHHDGGVLGRRLDRGRVPVGVGDLLGTGSPGGDHRAVGSGVERLVLAIGRDGVAPVGVDHTAEAARHPCPLQRCAVEHRRRCRVDIAPGPGHAARRPRREHEQRDRATGGELPSVRRCRARQLGAPGTSDQRAQREPGGQQRGERHRGPPQRVDDERPGSRLDRRLGASEELQVALQVRAQRLERAGAADLGDARRDLVHDHPCTEEERQRRVDREGAERTEVHRDRAVRRDLVRRLVRAEAEVGRRRGDAEDERDEHRGEDQREPAPRATECEPGPLAHRATGQRGASRQAIHCLTRERS
ncbi:hypothetical protein GALL_422930 [mine drainage metagenome]|uniref:Uncharacterized protein n=1 Tax=mine drainage metagenome TaxID=410659 RepID=A0A1J5Q7P8_9ZZZZ